MLNRSLLRMIKSTLGRYLAIFAIIALGTGFFIGLRVARDAMLETADDYLSELNFYDIRLVSTLGLTDADVAIFAREENVEAAEGSVSADFMYRTKSGADGVLHAHTLLPDTNLPDLVEGRLPQRPDEVVLDETFMGSYWIGQTITLSETNKESTLEMFRYDSYTVVGTIHSPYYCNFERGSTSLGSGSVSGFCYMLPGAFDTDYYTEIFLRLADMPPTGSDEYDEAIDGVRDSLENLLEERGRVRYASLKDENQEKIDDAQAEIDDGYAKIDDAKKDISDAKKKLADAEKELRDARKELDDGWAELSDAEQELLDARKELDDGWAEYSDGLAAYEDGKKKYEDGLAEYEKGLKEYKDGEREADSRLAAAKQQLDDAEAGLATLRETIDGLIAQKGQIEAALPYLTGDTLLQAESALAALNAQIPVLETQYANGMTELAAGRTEYEAGARAAYNELDRAWKKLKDGKKELDEAKEELDDAETELRDALTELEDGEREYADGVAEYEDGKKELEDGEKEYADGLAKYKTKKREADETIRDAEADIADAEQDLAEGQEKVNDAQADLDDLKEANVYVLDRESNMGYASLENDTAIVRGIAKVFPLFFFLVASLVCITTMTRMVDEQRTENGTLKALGFSDRKIIGRYLFYAGSASLLGCFTGFFVGSRYMPMVLWKIYKIMYSIDRPIAYVLDWKLFAFSTVLYLFCALGATWIVCRKDLNEAAAELIRPKAPQAGKRVLLERIPAIWNRLNFLRKVSFRNIFLYKKRMIMMILGIGGCTALLLTGFGIRDTIKNIVDFQYEEICTYDGVVSFLDEKTAEDEDVFRKEHADCVRDVAFLSVQTMNLSVSGETEETNVVAFREPLTGFVDIHTGKTELEWPKKGEAIIDYRLARAHDLKVGDTVKLVDDDFNTIAVTLTGIFDNYLYDYVFVSEETFLEQWGEAPARKAAYLNFDDGADVHAASAKILSGDGVLNVSLSADMMTTVDNMLQSMDYVVLIVLVCAGALAFIVLYNLTNISINERKREIATLKVLGFYANETSQYVFRENLILTGISAVFGIPMGIVLLRYVMSQVIIKSMYFGCRLAPLSYVWAILITFVFAVLIDLILKRKIDGIDMAESMKAIE